MEQVAADLKMELVFSEVGFPRGRGKIERFFQTVEQMLLPDLPGYTPEGQPPAPAQWSLPAFEEVFRTWLLDEYLQRPQKEIGATPQACWEASGFLPQMPDSLEQLDLLLLQVAKGRRVHQDGIYFEGKRYLDLTLAAYVGEDVTIRYDPRDIAELRVFYQDAFLCRAICAELAGQTISLKEIQAARTAQRKTLRETLTDRQQVVERYLAVHRPPEMRPPEESEPSTPPPPRLKRYMNE
jgi:putative transposase